MDSMSALISKSMLVALLATAGVVAAGSSPTAVLPFGTLQGKYLASGISEFLSIPYASVPERYAKAQDWTDAYENNGTRDAREWGPICPQPDMGFATKLFKKYSEDCLFLNVWTPSAHMGVSDLKPVLVFVHGGSFIHGSGNMFNGSALAANHDVVVISLNYRLANFGFLAFSELQGISNNGLLDQQSALRFVQKHIAAFGEDASRVLLFGESAGAMSVQMHALMPSSKGLFSAVLSESGFPQTRSLVYAEKASAEFAGLVGCNASGNNAADMISCLRNASLDDLLAAENKQSGNPFSSPGWSPTNDGDVFPMSPAKALLTGSFDSSLTQWIAGSNTDEGTMFVYPDFLLSLNATGYRAFIKRTVDGHGAKPLNATQWRQLFKLYEPNEKGDNRPIASRLLGDATFICGSRFFLRHIAKKAAGKTRMYHFDFLRSELCSLEPKAWGVAHASELPYAFDQPRMNKSPCSSFSAQGSHLANTMGTFWSKFAADAIDRDDDAVWPIWEPERELNILFNRTGETEIEAKRHAKACDFWEDVFAYRQDD